LKLLSNILYKINLIEVIGRTDVSVASIQFDSRKIEKSSTFFATKGTTNDGHQFINEVIAKGATAIVCEEFPAEIKEGITYVKTANAAKALGIAASNFYDNPSEKLQLVGITGTNGKTTVATLLHQLFSGLGYKCGLLSTVQNKIGEQIIVATHTTPDAVSLNKLLHEMVEAGCDKAFMEVSSHAIHQNRIAGLKFVGGIFTNITHDHLDYHKTFEEYLKVKKSFFDDLPSDAFAISNIDDKRGNVMLQNTKAKRKTYSLRQMADFKALILENTLEGLLMQMDGIEIHFRLVGKFNAYNLLAVYAAAMLMDEKKNETLQVLSNLGGAEGRFEVIRNAAKKITGIVDYAHTPDALQNVIETINNIRNGAGKLITVVGCGGDRDKAKRPLMAEIACKGSELIILTSDNPRSEEPDAILNEMKTGIPFAKNRNTFSVTDRKEAIKLACSMASADDVILVAGKGHEKYQEIKGVKNHFDDVEVVKEFLNDK
jgi:UDP-N-acetylmuramoyl-L-alanyl-D-glutamate--2,6-diaminopimelate ligase